MSLAFDAGEDALFTLLLKLLVLNRRQTAPSLSVRV